MNKRSLWPLAGETIPFPVVMPARTDIADRARRGPQLTPI